MLFIFCYDCVYVKIVMLSWVECDMFRLVNEGEYGMHNN